MVDCWETLSVLPEELHQSQLREDANNIGSTLLSDEYPMYPTAKDFYGLGQVCCVGKRDQWLLVAANVFDILERDWLPLSSLLGKLIKGRNVSFVWVCEADHEEEVGIQVAVIERARGMAGVGVFTQ